MKYERLLSDWIKKIWGCGRSTVINLFLVALFCLPSGCMTPAEQLDQSFVSNQLREGQSQAEVRKVFGQPRRMDVGSTGKQLDVFLVSFPKPGQPTSLLGMGLQVMEVRSLYVLYSNQGRVEKFTSYVGEIKGLGPRLDEPWQAGYPLATDKINQIQRHVTTREDLIKIFGPATTEGLDVHGDKSMSWLFAEGRNTSLTGGRELSVILDSRSVATDYSVFNHQR